MDVGELLRFGIFDGPQGLTLNHQRKEVLGPLLRLAYLHWSPFVEGRLLCPESFPNTGFPIQSCGDVDSSGVMDPQGGGSVSNISSLSTNGQLYYLGVASVVVAFGVDLEGDFPFFSEGGKRRQKGVPLQKMFSRKGIG